MFRCPACRRCSYCVQVPGTKDETLICAVGRRISHPSYMRLSSLRTGSSALVDVMTLGQFLPHPRHFTAFPYPTLSSLSTSFSSPSIVFFRLSSFPFSHFQYPPFLYTFLAPHPFSLVFAFLFLHPLVAFSIDPPISTLLSSPFIFCSNFLAISFPDMGEYEIRYEVLF